MSFLLTVVTFSIIAVVILFVSGWFCIQSAGRCKSHVSLHGKTVLVTGATSGLGFETALALAGRGARLIIADVVNAEYAKQSIIKLTHNKNIVTKYVDFSSLKTVREMAQDILATEERLDILVNNAGICGENNSYTKDNLHNLMQVNHFAPFLLTNLLTGLLKKSAPSRIVFVSSAAAFFSNLTLDNLNYPSVKRSYLSAALTYSNSKLCNILVSDEFSRKLEGTGVTTYSLHPGLVNTSMFNKLRSFNYELSIIHFFCRFFAKTSEEGAQTAIHTAVSNVAGNTSGKFWWDCKCRRKPKAAYDKKFAGKIWDASEKFVDLQDEEKHF